MSEIVLLDHEDGFEESAGGLLLPEHLVRGTQRKRRPTCVDLFAGCGGFSLGFMQAGFQVLAGVDNDPAAAWTYMHNLGSYPCQFHFVDDSDRIALERTLSRGLFPKPKKGKKQRERITEHDVAGSGWIAHEKNPPPGVGHFWLGDIYKITGQEILKAIGLQEGELDCIIGGPPCQGFSRANSKASKDDPRNNLVFEFLRLVCEIKPKAMCMENVPQLANMTTPDGIPMMDAITRVLEDGDFATLDGLREAMKHQAGITVLRRRKAAAKKEKPKPQKKPAPTRPPSTSQPDLFGGPVA